MKLYPWKIIHWRDKTVEESIFGSCGGFCIKSWPMQIMPWYLYCKDCWWIADIKRRKKIMNDATHKQLCNNFDKLILMKVSLFGFEWFKRQLYLTWSLWPMERKRNNIDSIEKNAVSSSWKAGWFIWVWTWTLTGFYWNLYIYWDHRYKKKRS